MPDSIRIQVGPRLRPEFAKMIQPIIDAYERDMGGSWTQSDLFERLLQKEAERLGIKKSHTNR